MTIQLPSGRGETREQRLKDFANYLNGLQAQVGFKVSARGWAYILEQNGFITKAQFDIVEGLVNECRTKGILPVDFVAEEESRGFSGVEAPEDRTPEQYMAALLRGALNAEEYYTPNWWDGEDYYIQMVVEKIDLKTLFNPVCQLYHIPIATSKGWSSILQRAEYARRFLEAEERGLKCVLLYCGDHDPDGLRISEFLQSNLFDIMNITWGDGTEGYDPSDLTILRFGLNFDFIQANALTWIDNLITGSGRDLGSPSHPNHRMPYVQDYLAQYGRRKCEGNALVTNPQAGRDLCEAAIVRYVGRGARGRFEAKRQAVRDRLTGFRERTGLGEAIQTAIDQAEEGDEGEET